MMQLTSLAAPYEKSETMLPWASVVNGASNALRSITAANPYVTTALPRASSPDSTSGSWPRCAQVLGQLTDSILAKFRQTKRHRGFFWFARSDVSLCKLLKKYY